jgi:hypothetical protein
MFYMRLYPVAHYSLWSNDTDTRRAYCLQRNVLGRSEVFTAATMKNAVVWDIKPSSYFTGDTLFLRYIVQPVNAM